MLATISAPTKRQIALDYGLRGWKILPVHDTHDGHCTCPLGSRCPDAGVHLICNQGTLAATSDSALINRWYRQHPDADIALATGPESGVFAMVIRGEAGHQALEELEAQYGSLPQTPRIRCGGDEVCLFAWSPAWELPGVAQVEGLPLDIIGAGGWVRLPAGDESCDWIVDLNHARLARAPDWLLALLHEPEAPAEEPAEPTVNEEPAANDDVPAEVADADDPAEPGAEDEDATEPSFESTEAEKPARKREKRRKPPPPAPDRKKPASPVALAPGTTVRVGDRDVRIDAEFARFLPPLGQEELAQLEQNLLADGRCREPVIVWKGHDLLVEGHHRVALCLQHGLPPPRIEEVDLPDREAVKRWMIDAQVGRRNLSSEQASYLRGVRYTLEKQAHGGDRKGAGSSAQNEHLIGDTAEVLAAQFHVSPATIRRDAEYAGYIESIAETGGDTARQMLLAKSTKLTRKAVEALAGLAKAAHRAALDEIAESGRWRQARADRREEGAKAKGAASSRAKSLTIAKPLESAEALARHLLDFLGRKLALAAHAALGEILGLGRRNLARPRRARGKP